MSERVLHRDDDPAAALTRRRNRVPLLSEVGLPPCTHAHIDTRSEYVFQAVTWAPQGTVLSICASTVGARAVWAAEVPIVWRSGDFPGGISRTVAAGDAGTVSAAPPPLGQASPSVSVAPIPVPVVPANAVAVIVGVMTMLVLGAVVLVAVCHWRRRTAMSKPHPWEPELDGTPMCEVHAEEKAPRRELS